MIVTEVARAPLLQIEGLMPVPVVLKITKPRLVVVGFL